MRNIDKKEEAIKRMKLMGIFDQTIKQFEDEDKVSVSEPPLGACFWIDGETLERVENFEKMHNALVYHVIKTYSNLGVTEEYFFVSDYPDEWDLDKEDIKFQKQMVYVYNVDIPDCSEIGTIGFRRTAAHGLERIW